MPKATKRQVEAWWYVLLSEQKSPREEQSRFLLQPLTQAERARVWDDFKWVAVAPDGSRAITSRAMQQAYSLVLTKLVETENFPTGEAKAWPADGTPEQKQKYLDLLDDMDVFEIGNAIREKSTLEEEVKNS